jgi:hypothetical protein
MQIALHLVLAGQKNSGVCLLSVCAVWRGSLVGSRLKERGVTMAIVPLHQGFSFIIDPVPSEQVQFWISYAGQVLTQTGFEVVSHAFNGFWWMASAHQSYQMALRCFGSDVPSLIFYLDMIVQELQVAMNHWARVVERIGRAPMQFERWREDAIQCVQTAMDLCLRVATQVAIWCDQYQQELPEHTQAFFTELQAKGM